jgi:lysophospholipase L1-like esterase
VDDAVALTFAVLGDSIAYGQGASYPADTVGARLTADLAASGILTVHRVFAASGALSRALAGQVESAAVWSPDLALIIIGTNDLTHFVLPDEAAADLAVAVSTLRAGGTEVVVAAVPDLSVMPWIPEEMRSSIRAGCVLLREAQIRAASAAGATIADIDGGAATFAADPRMFSADRFHPSSAGYAVIAAALAPAIHSAAATVTSRRSRAAATPSTQAADPALYEDPEADVRA